MAALSAAEAADEALVLAEVSVDVVDGVLGVTTAGADGVTVVVVSSFLLQAVNATAASRAARTWDVFMDSPGN